MSDFLAKATSVDKKISPKTPKKSSPSYKVDQQAIEVLDKALAMDLKNSDELFKKPDVSPEAIYAAFKNFEKVVGGRQALLDTLSHCPPNSLGYKLTMKLVGDHDFIAMTTSMMDSREKLKYTLAALCSRHRIPLNVVVAAFRDSRMAQNAIGALVATSTSAPIIMEQLVNDAKNRWEECPGCRGQGRIKKINEQGEWARDEEGNVMTSLCFRCRGEGVEWKEHDFSNRQKFLEIAGILKKEPLVQQNFDQRSVNVGTPDDGSYETLMKKLDNIARARVLATTTVVESEVIDVQSKSHS